jgi:hypothetical protein
MLVSLAAVLPGFAAPALAQAAKDPAAPQTAPQPAKPTPDVLIFTNGDQLTGKLERAAGGNVVFASDMAGELTVAFDKIKEIRSGSNPNEFAVLKKGVPVTPKVVAPEGSVTLADGHFIVHPEQADMSPESSSVAESIPTSDVQYLIERKEFDREIAGKHRFRDGWSGSVTGGATLVRSTTTSTTLTAALNLIRALPTVAWLPSRNRTTLNVVETYGKNTSPGAIPQTNPPTPDVTTLASIFHADAERDEYFTQRFYALGDVSFDHNYALGTQLQQIYGAGIGWTPIKTAKQQLDVKADVHYEKLSYITAPVNGTQLFTTPGLNLVGTTVGESYLRHLPRKVLFTQSMDVIPSFNDSKAYSANLLAALNVPVFKRLSATISATDNFLNDPNPGYKKNSFQFVTGVTYALK